MWWRRVPFLSSAVSLLPVLSKVFTKITDLLSGLRTTICKKKSKLVIQKNSLQLIKYLAYKRCVKNIVQKRREDFMLFSLASPKFLIPYHILLWYKLIRRSWKIVKSLNSMYANLKSCVRTHSGLTEYFQCTAGTRQGCMLSPFLFALHVGELQI